MQAFGVSTWDEVLTFFGEGALLEGRWGWLEMLRKAQNGDVVVPENPANVRWYNGGLWPLECEAGTLCGSTSGVFGRGKQGEILVSGRAHSEFALWGNEYALYERGLLGHSNYASFYTGAEWIHYHPKYDWGRVDKEDIGIDVSGIALSFLEAAPPYAWAATRAGWTLDAYSISKDLAEWDQMGQPGPQEAMGIWAELGADYVGTLPVAGIAGDVTGLVVNVGKGIYWIP